MNSSSNAIAASGNHPPAPQPAPASTPSMALPTPKDAPFAPLHSSVAAAGVPYAVAQPTPNGSGPPQLPPIATARPVGHISGIHSHLPGGSNLPTSNALPPPPHHLPVIATQVPIGISFEHTQFRYLDATRWLAGLMLMYYIATFVFLQPFVLGVAGMLTAFVGYFGARPPLDAVRIKWVRSYLYLNYVMVMFNVWLLAIALFYTSAPGVTPTSGADDDASGHAAYYSGQNIGVVVAVLVAINCLFHIRGIQTARALYAELLTARLHTIVPAVIVMANVA
ncbi:hypothetical protein PybrP1_002417 [[Pythium] brassicae (nom. inval.)]|nr:hypothetical protein PybrP1_002417 [[Pythium] brassicae (nom. inval.)]